MAYIINSATAWLISFFLAANTIAFTPLYVIFYRALDGILFVSNYLYKVNSSSFILEDV